MTTFWVLKCLSDPPTRRALAEYYEAFEPGIQRVTPSREDYILASGSLQNFKSGLRSGDALHLAIAVNLKVSRLLTMNKVFVKAARGIFLSVELPW